jgi:hypothetical protein
MVTAIKRWLRQLGDGKQQLGDGNGNDCGGNGDEAMVSVIMQC